MFFKDCLKELKDDIVAVEKHHRKAINNTLLDIIIFQSLWTWIYTQISSIKPQLWLSKLDSSAKNITEKFVRTQVTFLWIMCVWINLLTITLKVKQNIENNKKPNRFTTFLRYECYVIIRVTQLHNSVLLWGHHCRVGLFYRTAVLLVNSLFCNWSKRFY